MRKIIVAAALSGVLLNLTACVDTEQATRNQKSDLEEIKQNMPAGCEFNLVGAVRTEYDPYHPLVVGAVRCDGKKTVTTNSEQEASQGKSTISLHGVTYELTPVDKSDTNKKDSDNKTEAKN